MSKPKIEKTDAEWRAQLSPEQYRVAARAVTAKIRKARNSGGNRKKR